ncbi:hypothetical protein GCM10023147_52100 [Tsukamurella soli]|uniref:WYL domain-containing protein n=1 Tax=Tsukamurella soli TaxID=644556 RepID=A0ABP8KJU5_9ACTN
MASDFPAAVPGPEQLADATAALRRQDTASLGTVRPATGGVDTMALLEQARSRRRPVRLGYVDANGTATQQIVVPMLIRHGQLTARTEDGAPQVFSLHRVTDVADVLQ